MAYEFAPPGEGIGNCLRYTEYQTVRQTWVTYYKYCYLSVNISNVLKFLVNALAKEMQRIMGKKCLHYSLIL